MLLLTEKINWNYVGLVIYYKLGVNITASMHYNVLSWYNKEDEQLRQLVSALPEQVLHV